MNRFSAVLAMIVLSAAAAVVTACSETVSDGGGAGGSDTGTTTGTPSGTSSGSPSGSPSGTPSGTAIIDGHDFSVTIDNQSSAAIFVDGLVLPFDLFQGSDYRRLWGFCECSRCGTGNDCMHGDPVPVAVEIPAGDTMLVEANLRWYSSQSVTAADCPEASFYGECDLAQIFAAGSYEIVVRYDDLAAITSQGLEETPNAQWDHAVWMGQGIGTVLLSNEQRQSFELSGGASALSVVITE